MNETQESLHFLDYWRIISSRKEVVLAVSMLVVITGIIVTYSMPKVYRSSVVIQVKEEAPDLSVFTPEMWRHDPLFLRTQFEIIQSGPIVEEVVRRLQLTDKLGKAYGYLQQMNYQDAFDFTTRLLSKRMKVQQYRDTNLIEIQVFMDEPEAIAPAVAAETANAFAEVFRDQNQSRNRQVTDRALKALKLTLDEQKEEVHELAEKVADVREKHGIAETTMMYSSTSIGNVLERETLRILETQRIAARLEYEDKKVRYEKCKALPPRELLAAAPWLAGDPALAALVKAKREAEIRKEALLRGGYGAKHPEVEKEQGNIDAVEKEIGDALDGLKMGLLADYEAARAKYTAIAQELTNVQIRVVEKAGHREYETALAELDRAQKIRDALQLRYVEENIEQRIPRTAVEVVEPAKAPDGDDPVSPNKALNIILSVVLGLGAGIGLAYFIEYLDTSVKTIEDIERYLDLSVLGVIPQKVKPLIEEDADPAHAEAYRVLRTNLQSAKKLQKGNAVCITSGSVGEGKSLTLFNLAYTCASLGDSVLVIDSDLHRPRQHKMLAVSNRSGLANILVGETELDEALIHTDYQNLDFLPSGKLSGGVHGLLDTEQMKALVETVKARYDYVFFDAPPIVGVSDASLLSREMDGVLLVVQHRKYPRALSSRAKSMVENTGANLLGVVLNNINISRDYSSYYYQQHYYSYPKRGSSPSAKRRSTSSTKQQPKTATTAEKAEEA